MLRALYILTPLTILLFAVVGCRQAKYVADGKYLHKKNTIHFAKSDSTGTKISSSHEVIDVSGLDYYIRPQPNSSFKLWIYNRIDTTKYKQQVKKRTEKNRKKNQKRQAREDRINKKRIGKAKAKGDDEYVPKRIESKELKLGWRHNLRTKFGEAPVIFDSSLVERSKKQMQIYLKKQGYYYGIIKDSVYFKEKKQKSFVDYTVTPGSPYIINSVAFDTLGANKTLLKLYTDYRNEEGASLKAGDRIIENNFKNERIAFSKYCRDNALYKLTPTYVNFVVDTSLGNSKANITVFVKKKAIDHPDYPDSLVYIHHVTHRVKRVRFFLHNTDKNSFVGGFENYQKRCLDFGHLGISSLTGDTTYRDEKGQYFLLDTINIPGKGTYIFNGEPFLEPHLLDVQNFEEIYLPEENNNYYKDYYLERTYRALANLGVFSTITPDLYLNPDKPFGNEVFVDYQLYPLNKQSFVIEPKATNTNSALGIFSTVSYQNLNLSQGAQKIKFSFSGGFESQPLIVENEGEREGFFNTWEIEPKLSLEFPQLLPFHLLTDELSKRMFPTTQVAVRYNFQKRSEFVRNIASFIWTWKWIQDKVQDWQVQPFYVDFVRLRKEDFFQERLDELSDPFIIDSYSDHFTTLVGVTYHFNNERSDRRTRVGANSNNPRKGKHKHDVLLSVKESGGILDLIGIGSLDPTLNQLTILNVPYTQFVKVEGQYILNQFIDKRRRIVYRFVSGLGYAFGNSQSLPYEQSFFAGGSNDIRAFQARTMAPGATRTYTDPNSTTTQLGDIKLELNVEYRFDITSTFKGALFVDAGNIWKLNSASINDPGVFGWSTFLEQCAVGTGFGLRMDLDFLIIRLDLAFPLYNPYLIEGERWFLKEHPDYDSYFLDIEGELTDDYIAPHRLRLNFGIGYPF